MRASDSAAPLPEYSYVPGGPWPHPNRSCEAQPNDGAASLNEQSSAHGSWWKSLFLHGARLFNAGYYWEAHEVWEELWHAEGRRGPTADVVKALIKLAAAGVKVRERRENGVRTHCRRAAALFAAAAGQGGPHSLGLDLHFWAERSREWAENPPRDPGPPDAPVTQVFPFQLEPERSKFCGE
jgi:hypothetical protein